VTDDRVLMALPELYHFGREARWFNFKLFNIFMIDGVVQVSLCLGLLCFSGADVEHAVHYHILLASVRVLLAHRS
jgi:Phospholipid-translocating P-type ATPase C-terminal